MRVTYLPALLMCCGAVSCVMISVYDTIHPERFEDPVFLDLYDRTVIMTIAINITLTWYFTGMICYRLWAVERQTRALVATQEETSLGSDVTSPYARIIRILVHSGMLSSVAEGAFLVSIATGSVRSEEILNDANVRIVGIVAVLIMLVGIFDLSTGRHLNTPRYLQFCRVPYQQLHSTSQRDAPISALSHSMPVFRVIETAGSSGTKDNLDDIASPLPLATINWQSQKSLTSTSVSTGIGDNIV
ncbi:hypothetical protein FRB97_007152 [Tulasnella sp. 331]|nr:hypothetical protein FRB97_007152 [Tulasnella sp. 331]